MSDAVEGLRTPRLLLRRWREEDDAPMAAINSDPAVTELLNRRMDAAAITTFLDRTREHWAVHGFGHWAVEPLDGPVAGEMIGFVGVAYPSYLPEVADSPELGWRLSPASWGHGYATEAALAARDDAFDRLVLPALISIIHPENARSRRVAEKLGMAVERQVFNPVHDRDVDIWQVLAP
ncbi:MAG: GNAT family N-acetyltransferase [Actinobacteria bacterium]|nr:GNAT family N-acetyltransferase [Actinomycetota bacterium]